MGTFDVVCNYRSGVADGATSKYSSCTQRLTAPVLKARSYIPKYQRAPVKGDKQILIGLYGNNLRIHKLLLVYGIFRVLEIGTYRRENRPS